MQCHVLQDTKGKLAVGSRQNRASNGTHGGSFSGGSYSQKDGAQHSTDNNHGRKQRGKQHGDFLPEGRHSFLRGHCWSYMGVELTTNENIGNV